MYEVPCACARFAGAKEANLNHLLSKFETRQLCLGSTHAMLWYSCTRHVLPSGTQRESPTLLHTRRGISLRSLDNLEGSFFHESRKMSSTSTVCLPARGARAHVFPKKLQRRPPPPPAASTSIFYTTRLQNSHPLSQVRHLPRHTDAVVRRETPQVHIHQHTVCVVCGRAVRAISPDVHPSGCSSRSGCLLFVLERPPPGVT